MIDRTVYATLFLLLLLLLLPFLLIFITICLNVFQRASSSHLFLSFFLSLCLSFTCPYYTLSLFAVAKSLRCCCYCTRLFLYLLLLYACLPARLSWFLYSAAFSSTYIISTSRLWHTVKRYDVWRALRVYDYIIIKHTLSCCCCCLFFSLLLLLL